MFDTSVLGTGALVAAVVIVVILVLAAIVLLLISFMKKYRSDETEGFISRKPVRQNPLTYPRVRNELAERKRFPFEGDGDFN